MNKIYLICIKKSRSTENLQIGKLYIATKKYPDLFEPSQYYYKIVGVGSKFTWKFKELPNTEATKVLYE